MPRAGLLKTGSRATCRADLRPGPLVTFGSLCRFLLQRHVEVAVLEPRARVRALDPELDLPSPGGGRHRDGYGVTACNCGGAEGLRQQTGPRDPHLGPCR